MTKIQETISRLYDVITECPATMSTQYAQFLQDLYTLIIYVERLEKNRRSK